MDKLILIGCMLVISTTITTAQPQVNELGGPLSFSCAPFNAPTIIRTTFHPSVGDRLWFVQCAPIPGVWDVCYNTRIFSAGIPRTGTFCEGGILAGAQSGFVPSYRDREWSFQCCFSSQFFTTDCRSTIPFLFRQNFNFQAPIRTYLVGMTGFYNRFAWDRRWSFTVCRIAFPGRARRLSLRKGRGGRLKFPVSKPKKGSKKPGSKPKKSQGGPNISQLSGLHDRDG